MEKPLYFFENETKDIRFDLIFNKYYAEDPMYNTIIHINVKSSGFYGCSEWTVDINEFIKFIKELKEFYNKLNGKVKFVDREYGSSLNISCDKRGNILFEGTLKHYGHHCYKLEYEFEIEQSYMKNFVDQLYVDFIERKIYQ